MHIRVIHGPNLNMLGVREPTFYGSVSLEEINRRLDKASGEIGVSCECLQSNFEGQIVSWIQEAVTSKETQQIDGFLLNLGAYTHTSIAIRDALLTVGIPFVEVHMSNVYSRESFRHTSMVADIALGVISGFAERSYTLGLHALVSHLRDL